LLGIITYLGLEYALSNNGRIYIFLLIFAIVASIIVAQFFLSLFRWKYSVLTLDKSHKSAADYD